MFLHQIKFPKDFCWRSKGVLSVKNISFALDRPKIDKSFWIWLGYLRPMRLICDGTVRGGEWAWFAADLKPQEETSDSSSIRNCPLRHKAQKYNVEEK